MENVLIWTWETALVGSAATAASATGPEQPNVTAQQRRIRASRV